MIFLFLNKNICCGQGSSWSFQRERSFETISGRSFGPNFGFPYTFYTFSLLTQDREKSASLGRLFLPNRPLGVPLEK